MKHYPQQVGDRVDRFAQVKRDADELAALLTAIAVAVVVLILVAVTR
jgi:hypothetical protein